MSSPAAIADSVATLDGKEWRMRWEPDADETMYTLTLGRNGVPWEQFALSHDHEFFRNVSPLQFESRLVPVVNLDWVKEFFELSVEERREKYHDCFQVFVWMRWETMHRE